MNRIAVLFAVAALVVPAAAGDPARDDEAIRLNIETSLTSAHGLAGERLTAGFAAGHASLSGTVHTLYQKWQAVEAAARVRGVVTLADGIEVVAPPQSDAVLAAAVRRRFEDVSKVAAANLRVEASDGKVTLEGNVRDARIRFDARDAAAQISGVVAVVDRISSPESPDDRLQKDVESLLGPGSLQRVPGEIKVTVAGGVAHLEGWVPRLWDRIDAERRALGINGIKDIVNDLEVRPPKRRDADWR